MRPTGVFGQLGVGSFSVQARFPVFREDDAVSLAELDRIQDRFEVYEEFEARCEGCEFFDGEVPLCKHQQQVLFWSLFIPVAEDDFLNGALRGAGCRHFRAR
jgi:hypothetical protein